ncbi:MAG: ABC transporter substrate-binding protein [Desulfobacterales bacterium]|nr:MAG: ABC transporter substrate-binding protein [Desulfobacterales bacterium]
MGRNWPLRQTGQGLVLFFVLLTAISVFSGCGSQAAPPTYRVGILDGFTPFSAIADGFKAKMTELGYVEGQNIIYDLHQVDVDLAVQQRVLSQFVADQVDLIFVFPTGPALTAKAATRGTDIPVVFAMGSFEGTGLIENVRQPGGNITGVRTPGPEVVVKRFELLCELVPQAKRIYATYNISYQANQPALEALRPAASALAVTLVEVPVTRVEDIQADLQARAASGDIGMDAILIMPDDLSQSPTGWPLISRFAQKHKLAVSGGALYEAETGATFSYIPDYVESGKLAAVLADKILRGTPAGDIPVATPVETLWLNYRKTQELGLTVPEELLNLATEIIR